MKRGKRTELRVAAKTITKNTHGYKICNTLVVGDFCAFVSVIAWCLACFPGLPTSGFGRVKRLPLGPRGGRTGGNSGVWLSPFPFPKACGNHVSDRCKASTLGSPGGPR